MTTDETLLKSSSFFNLLDDQKCRELAGVLNAESHKAGQLIFHLGDPGESLYIVRSGKVELFVKDSTGERISLMEAKPGDVFGEISMLDHGPRTASALVLEDCELLVLDREHLLQFIRKMPNAAMDLLAIVGGRVRNADKLALGRVAKNVNTEVEHVMTAFQRMASFIANFSGSMPFLGLNAFMFTSWIVINVGLIPGVEPFDPYPFGFLTMAVSLEAIFLSIFVLLAQNLHSAKEKIKGDIEYDVNIKAELEVAHLHEKVDLLHSEVTRRMHSLEKFVKTMGHAA
jgi:uncharacterized membrane protein